MFYCSCDRGFNGHFPGKAGLAGCRNDSQFPDILSLNILQDTQAEILHIFLF